MLVKYCEQLNVESNTDFISNFMIHVRQLIGSRIIRLLWRLLLSGGQYSIININQDYLI
jgi:hypothetical protein